MKLHMMYTDSGICIPLHKNTYQQYQQLHTELLHFDCDH